MKRRTSHTATRKFSGALIFISLGLLLYLGIRYLSSPVASHVEIGELPEDYRSHGIDVSHHQGTIDWDLLLRTSGSKISFIYCKATEGIKFVDPSWMENRAYLSSSNIAHGAYHFFSPRTNALTQADHFLNHYNAAPSDLPPVLDAETEGESDSKLISGMKEWLKSVEAQLGVRPVIYTSYHFYTTKFRGKFDGYQFWIASYNTNEARLADDCIIHWQYTDRGKLLGIDELVDLNYSKLSFTK